MNKKLLLTLVMGVIGSSLLCQEEVQIAECENNKQYIANKWGKMQDEKCVILDRQGERFYRCFVIACLATFITAYTAEKTTTWFLRYHWLNPAAVFTNIAALLLVMREFDSMGVDNLRYHKRTEQQEELQAKFHYIEQYLIALKKRLKDGPAAKLEPQPQE